MLSEEVVYLVDVDNTLLDNDRFQLDLGNRLEHCFGADQRMRYWSLFEELRSRSGIADYIGGLQAFRAGLEDHPELLGMSDYLLDYPFAELLFPGALSALARLRGFGRVVVLSDGDAVFQPRKVRRSGISSAVDGAVLIYVHKERALDHVQKRFPASHYVMFDDKPNLLAAMKTALSERLTTVLVRQGRYALAPGADAIQPKADRAIERIGDLAQLTQADFHAATMQEVQS